MVQLQMTWERFEEKSWCHGHLSFLVLLLFVKRFCNRTRKVRGQLETDIAKQKGIIAAAKADIKLNEGIIKTSLVRETNSKNAHAFITSHRTS